MAWERSIEILNFGALMAFMAVNLAAMRHFGFSSERTEERRPLLDIVVPGMGFAFWPGYFSWPAAIDLGSGAVWLIVGGVYVAWKTKVLRQPVAIDFTESSP